MNTELVNPVKISNFCRDILREYTNNNINVSCEENDPCYYYLQGEGLMAMPGTYGNEVPVIPLKNKGYTVHFEIVFIKLDKRKNSHNIKGVSLQVFRNGALLFRAEWDNVDERKTIHPQPHWHIEPITMFDGKEVEAEVKEFFVDYLKDEQNQSQETNFLSVLDGDSYSKTSSFKYHDFHFAMSAEWHKNLDKCNVPLTEINLKNWLKQCLDSINTQLNNIGI